ncbi:acyltransferase-domain-containing protein, partial [Meredithblackwellia eburnea MCA 4105]
RYYLRLTVYLTGLATCSVWGVIISIIYKVLGKSKDVNWVVARSFHGLVAPLVGVKFKIEGEEILSLPENKPAVLVGNHQTMIDILYLGRIFPKGASIMAKKELKFTPFLGQYMTFSDAVFVNRSKRADAVRVFGEVAKVMKSKVLSLFIFPEGTRSASQTPTLLPFKKGAFHLAVQAKLPIVPIVCENYAHVYSAKSKRFEAGEVTIRVLPPIPTTTLSDPPTSEEITALTEKTRTLMLEALEEMT